MVVHLPSQYVRIQVMVIDKQLLPQVNTLNDLHPSFHQQSFRVIPNFLNQVCHHEKTNIIFYFIYVFLIKFP